MMFSKSLSSPLLNAIFIFFFFFSSSPTIYYVRAEHHSSSSTGTTKTTTTTTTTTQCASSSSVMSSDSIFVLEGIELAETKEVSSSSVFLLLDDNNNDDAITTTTTLVLHRNGEGVRSINIFGYEIRVYVAGFWTLNGNLRTPEDVVACDGPKQMDFTFLRGFHRDKVIMAWTRQLDASAMYTDYDTYREDRALFLSLFGTIVQGGTQSIILMGDETIIIDQGIHKGSIKGKNFQRVFLSIWFGERPVTEELKSGFLVGRTMTTGQCSSSILA